MLAIEVNFLTGRFVAASHHDRSRSEWPPHPARLFSALVATWADADHPDMEERTALEWLEDLDPPSIAAPPATRRKVVTHFVPVNDMSVLVTAHSAAGKMADLRSRLNQEMTHSQGEETKEARSLKGKLAKQSQAIDKEITKTDKVTDKDIKNAIELFPERRNSRQPRQWPSVTPHQPRLTFIWDATPTDATRRALDGLLSRVTRLGHSSSLVSCRITEDRLTPSHVPSPGGQTWRAVRKGQLATLESEYQRHQGSQNRVLPFEPVRYRATKNEDQTGQATLRPNTAGSWHVFEFVAGSRRTPSTRTVEIASAMRSALFSYAQDPLPEGLTGHQSDGAPSATPHVAILPLPYVGSEHADGRIMGIAVSLPDSLDERARTSLLRAIGMWEKSVQGNQGKLGSHPELQLTFGPRGVLGMTRVTQRSALATLRPGVWFKGSRRWVSATPIALPAHPGPLGKGTAPARAKAWAKAEEALVASCHHVGLPEPEKVVLSLVPFIPGARPAHDFPAFRQRYGSGKQVARRLVHASVTFAEPVKGPLILGAGRFLGLGLMRPVKMDERKLSA